MTIQVVMQSQMNGETRKIILNDCEEIIGSVISISEDGFIQIDNNLIFLPDSVLQEISKIKNVEENVIQLLRIDDCYRFFLKQKDEQK